MRKRMFLGLVLIMAAVTSYAQQSVDPSSSGNINIANGTTVNFDIDLGVLTVGTVNIQAKELPGGALTTWSAVVVNVEYGGNIINYGTSGNSFTPNNDSVYEISYTFDSIVGPIISNSNTFYVIAGNGVLSVENFVVKSNFSLFSKDGMVTVKNDNESAVTGMDVFSVSGKRVFSSNKPVSSIDLRAVANGVYILSVQEGASVATKKFIKS